MENFDISEEFHIYRYGNGIKLLRPDYNLIEKNSLYLDTHQTIKTISILPLSMYFLNRGSAMMYANTFNLNLCEVENLKYLLGKTAYEAFGNKINKALIKNDKNVIFSNSFTFFDEKITHKDGSLTEVISIKFPLYDQNNSVTGIFGCSMNIKNNSISDSLTLISKLKLLNVMNINNFTDDKFNDIYLTTRENQIIIYVVKGKTAREISDILSISRRTVETHIDHVKNKIGVSTKSQLIEKFYLKFTHP